jgi:hypothetical protein
MRLASGARVRTGLVAAPPTRRLSSDLPTLSENRAFQAVPAQGIMAPRPVPVGTSPRAARMTRVAVVVTSYNYRDYVAEAVDSALVQTRAPDQVVVVDDGSTDGSADLLRERYGNDPRVTLLCTENGGQLAAFQRGVARVDADVICFLDSDDRWEPDYIARICEVFDSRPDVGFIFTDMRWFGDESAWSATGEKPIDFGFTAISTYAVNRVVRRADVGVVDAHGVGAAIAAAAGGDHRHLEVVRRQRPGLRRQRAGRTQVLPADGQRRLSHPRQQRLVVEPGCVADLHQPPALARADRALRAHGRDRRLVLELARFEFKTKPILREGNAALCRPVPARRRAVVEALRACTERAAAPPEEAALTRRDRAFDEAAVHQLP